jgi:hypothetical protein
MTEIDFNIFDVHGHFRNASLTEAVIATLEPAKVARLNAVKETAAALDKTDFDLREAIEARIKANNVLEQARKTLDNVRGVRTFRDEYLRSKLPPEEKMKPVPVPEAVQDALRACAAAEEVFENSRAAVRALEQERITALALVAKRVGEWQSEWPAVNFASLHGETIKIWQQRKADGTDRPPPTERQSPSVIDSHLAGGKGPAGVRSTRQAQRGAYPAEMRGRRVAPPVEAPWAIKPRARPPSER